MLNVSFGNRIRREYFSYHVRVHREIPRCVEDETTFPKGEIFFEMSLIGAPAGKRETTFNVGFVSE